MKSPDRQTAILCALIAALSAGVPGTCAIVQTVVERTLPQGAVATELEVEGLEVFEDEQSGALFVLEGQQELPVEFDPEQQQWVKGAQRPEAWRQHLAEPAAASPEQQAETK